MAVAQDKTTSDASPTIQFKGRHLTVGAMVTVSIVIAALLMVVLQRWAFQAPLKWDWTSSGINSLSPGTRALLDSLDDKEETVRLTSLYLKTDPEPESQKKYREAVNNLLRLYQVEKPSRVEWAWISPLHDQNKFNETMARVRQLPRFEEETEPYRTAIERFSNEIGPEFKAQIQQLSDELASVSQSVVVSGPSPAAQIDRALRSWVKLYEGVQEELEYSQRMVLPRYTDMVSAIRSFYTQVGDKMKIFTDIFVDQQLQGNKLDEPFKEVLGSMTEGLKPWTEKFSQEKERLENLPPLELANLERSVQRRNTLIVETSQGAKAVSFDELWPPMREGSFSDAGDFDGHRFAGEGAVTPAILQLLQTEKTAVVFVRYGGSSLFLRAAQTPFPFPQPGPLSTLKKELEQLNYLVAEWDLKQAQTPPELDADVGRSIYVITRPAPSQGQHGIPMPGRLRPADRAAILSKLDASARAIFLTGWEMLSPEYELSAYLKTKWGLEVDAKQLVISTTPIGPGQWALTRNPTIVTDITYDEHQLTAGLSNLRSVFVKTTHLKPAAEVPEEVHLERLAHVAASEDIWAISDATSFDRRYQETKNSRGMNYTYKTADDLASPFPLVYKATKGDAKIVVLAGGLELFHNQMLAPQTMLDLSAGKMFVQRQAPGNLALLINLLHDLNDTLEWLNVGSPIDNSRIQVSAGQLAWWRALTMGIWPALAMLGGGVAWFVRRR